MKEGITRQEYSAALSEARYTICVLNEKLDINNEKIKLVFYELEGILEETRLIGKTLDVLERYLCSFLTNEQIYGE